MYNALSSKVAFDNLEDQLSGPLGVHPVAADAVAVACHSDAWGVGGAYVEVVPASTITKDFFLDSLVIENVSAADTFLFYIATGAAAAEAVVALGRGAFGHVTNCGTLNIPIRKKISANTRIAVKAACKTAVALTASVSISYRTIS